jgi:REP element-mobilizing transposase RayT
MDVDNVDWLICAADLKTDKMHLIWSFQKVPDVSTIRSHL